MRTDLPMACDPEGGDDLLAHHNPRMKQVANTGKIKAGTAI
jgi:hypothetical protein